MPLPILPLNLPSMVYRLARGSDVTILPPFRFLYKFSNINFSSTDLLFKNSPNGSTLVNINLPFSEFMVIPSTKSNIPSPLPVLVASLF